MSDIVTSQIFSNGETGITATKMNNIIGQAAIQTSFVSGQPLASSIGTTDQFLLLTSGGTYARVPQSTLLTSVSGSLTPAGVGQPGIMNALSGNTTDYVSGANTCIDLTSAPAITLMRLRSYNAAGNSTFEVDQRNAGTLIANNQSWAADRWSVANNAATLRLSTQQTTGNIQIPGSNYIITNRYLRTTLTTVQASLAATEQIYLLQQVEGSAARELYFDATSISVLVRTSVAGLKFGVSLRDPVTTGKSLTVLATVPSANTWTLLTFPNLPVFPSGNFVTSPGVNGYLLAICLGAGTTFTSPANGTWQNGNFMGATGQNNWGAQTVNSTFDIAFIQHEPGPNCTQLIDCPFGANLDGPMGCTRYYQKTYAYSVKAGTATQAGMKMFVYGPVDTTLHTSATFPKIMAKGPTMSFYSPNSGNPAIYDASTPSDRAVTGTPAIGVSDSGYSGINLTANGVANMKVWWHHVADTGW